MKRANAITTPHYRQGLTSLVLLTVLLAGLITYKIGPALRNIGVARATGGWQGIVRIPADHLGPR